MAFELYGMLAGSVSPMTGEHIKPAYGGEDEAFLRKVVKPIYDTIAEVCSWMFSWHWISIFFFSFCGLLCLRHSKISFLKEVYISCYKFTLSDMYFLWNIQFTKNILD